MVGASIALVGCGGADGDGGASGAASSSADPQLVTEISSAASAAWSALNAARLDPTDTAKVDAAKAAFAGPALRSVDEILTQYGVTGQVSRTNDDTPSTIVPDPTSVALLTDGRASIVVCEIDTNILIQPGVGEGGSDVVVDDDVSAHRIQMTFTEVDGVWLEWSGKVLDTYADATSCPD